MSSAHGITVENLLRLLPEVLKSDKSMAALATSTAEALVRRTGEIQCVSVYPHIDELPEELLDILAYDFKVDWYDYNYSLASKRDLIKRCFFVHRRMGTKRSVEEALSAIYPGTFVEEWFEYGGDPYYFRVILDVTAPREPIDNEKMLRALDLYKPLRAHLEDDAIIYRSRVDLIVGTAWGYVIYTARRCGTWPQAATRGGMTREFVVVETADGRAVYAAPATGEAVTGTWPQAATRGGQAAGVVIVEGLDGRVVYTTPATGEAVTGTNPQTATRGGLDAGVVIVEGLNGQAVYTAPAAGTTPQTATRGGGAAGGLTFAEGGGAAVVTARPCGKPFGAL